MGENGEADGDVCLRAELLELGAVNKLGRVVIG
jgi:hypothetical protein